MQLEYVNTKLKFNGHLTLILAKNVPNWIERIFFARDTEHKAYVGHRTKWSERNHGNLTPVSPAIAKKLEVIESGVIEEFQRNAQKGMTMKSKAIK